MPDQFDLLQTTLAFSFAAGRAENIWGSKEDITDFFDKALNAGGTCNVIHHTTKPPPTVQPSELRVTGFLDKVGHKLLGRDWRIAWGPRVFADPLSTNPTCLANGMFVAHSVSQNTYIVAISATNFASLLYAFALMDTDDAPGHAVNFPVETTGTSVVHAGNDIGRPQLTGGTGLGVFNLVARMHVAPEVSVLQYLTRQGLDKNHNTKLIFAGHSLGGALAPCLALEFRNALTLSGWTPENILVLATAGATPGNEKFADEWTRAFSPVPVASPDPNNGMRHFNTLYWNRLDTVPYAFANLFGQGEDDWNKADPAVDPEKVDCPLGVCVDPKNRQENQDTMKRYLDAQECRLTKLPNASFTGRWPVRCWTPDGAKDTYPGQPPYPQAGASISRDDLMAAKQRAHMDQYLQFAGIDPWDIRPPLFSSD